MPVKRKGWDWAVGVDKNFAGEGPDLLELEQCSLGHRLPHFKRCFKAFGICGGGITRTKDIVMRSRRFPGAYALVSGAINDCMPCRRTGAGHRCTRRHPAQSRATGATHPEAASERHRDSPLAIALKLDRHCQSRRRTSEDFRESVEALHAKPKPRFTGR